MIALSTTISENSGCKIRLAKDADEAALRTFLRKSRQGFQHLLTGDPDGDLSCLEAFYNNRDGFIFLLEIEGRIVGSIALFAVDEFRCELRKFYLEPEVGHGGLGRSLLSSVLRVAKSWGFETIQVETLPRLVDAYALYARFGFKPSLQVRAQFIKGGHMLERPLSAPLEPEC